MPWRMWRRASCCCTRAGWKRRCRPCPPARAWTGYRRSLPKLGYIYGLEGKRAEVQSILNTLLAQADDPGRVAPSIALAYLGLGDTKKALIWVRTAAEQNSLIDTIPSTPFYDALRSDPKFTALIPELR